MKNFDRGLAERLAAHLQKGSIVVVLGSFEFGTKHGLVEYTKTNPLLLADGIKMWLVTSDKITLDMITNDLSYVLLKTYTQITLDEVFSMLKENRPKEIFIPTADISKYGWNRLVDVNINVLTSEYQAEFYKVNILKDPIKI